MLTNADSLSPFEISSLSLSLSLCSSRGAPHGAYTGRILPTWRCRILEGWHEPLEAYMITQSTNVEFSISCRIQHLLEPHLMQKRFYYLLRQKIMVFIFNILELIQSYWNYSIYYNIYTICNYIVYILSTTSAPAGSRWTTQVRLLQSLAAATLAETALFICYQTLLC